MKAQFIANLLSSPYCIDRVRGRSILANIVGTLLRTDRPSEDINGDPLPTMEIRGDVAIIPLHGVISMAVPDWIKAWGFRITDANDIEQEIDRALSHSEVRSIVIDSDSPGGNSLASEKLFDLIEAANRRKPVFGWVGDGANACSGAMWALASTRASLAGWYANAIGNVGCYSVHLDDSAYWAEMGIKWEVFRSGEFKAIGEDALSDDQRAYLQSIVDDVGKRIRASVKKYRTGISDEDLQGQWFTGTEAARRGFVAGNAKDLNAALVRFAKMV